MTTVSNPNMETITPELPNNTEISSSTGNFDVRPYTGKEHATQEGFRLSVVKYKKTEKRPVPPPAKCVQVPKIILASCDPAPLQSMLQDCIDDMQDEMIAAGIEKNQTFFTALSSGVTALMGYALEKAAGSRLNKESINDWFDLDLADLLTIAFLEKIAPGVESKNVTQEMAAKVGSIVENYKDLLSKLSAPIPDVTAVDASGLIPAVNLANDSKIKSTVLLKLDVISKAKTSKLMLNL